MLDRPRRRAHRRARETSNSVLLPRDGRVGLPLGADGDDRGPDARQPRPVRENLTWNSISTGRARKARAEPSLLELRPDRGDGIREPDPAGFVAHGHPLRHAAQGDQIWPERDGQVLRGGSWAVPGQRSPQEPGSPHGPPGRRRNARTGSTHDTDRRLLTLLARTLCGPPRPGIRVVADVSGPGPRSVRSTTRAHKRRPRRPGRPWTPIHREARL